MTPTFASLISPLNTNDFINSMFGLGILWGTWKENSDEECLSSALIRPIVESMTLGAIKLDRIRFVKEGEIIPTDVVLPNGIFDENVLFREMLEAGVSISVDQVECYSMPIKMICESISNSLQMPVAANLYISPPNSFAFEPHSDSTDILALQLSGYKRWRIHNGNVVNPLPIQSQHFNPNTRVIEDRLLNPLDWVYLRKGVIHSAITEVNTSIHVTFALNTVSVYSVILQIIEDYALENSELRASVPLSLNNEMVDYVHSLLPWADRQVIVNRLRRRLPVRESPDLIVDDIMESFF